MNAVSLESRCTDRLVPSPTKLPASRPAESIRASLANGSESSGAGGRSFTSSSIKRPVLAHPPLTLTPRARTAYLAHGTSRHSHRDMAGNVPAVRVERKGEKPRRA